MKVRYGLQGFDHINHMIVVVAEEDCLFVGKIIINGGVAHACLLGDAPHTGPLNVHGPDHLNGRPDNGLSIGLFLIL